ncbi:hypothetical protein IWC96_14420 [Brevundimonas sp. BAL450]|uniref:hypothetical protein n=1 Tax=Brevundimonas sp. BAL450 TaxID=1708162 RepID=UPI0018CBEE5D|nr:hypothetical protein [Brevundimonas sp. BAL450]MBG7616469.1 hypothetical protein [Brevundimonas sp. BAL450]
MPEVVAHSMGYYGGLLRQPGDRFQAEGTASWFSPFNGADPAAFDHDGDGKPVGSKPEPVADPASEDAIAGRARPVADDHSHAEPAPAPKAKATDHERAEVIAALKAKEIKFFMGAPTDKLKALLAEHS